MHAVSGLLFAQISLLLSIKILFRYILPIYQIDSGEMGLLQVKAMFASMNPLNVEGKGIKVIIKNW